MVKYGVLFEVRTEFLNNIYKLDKLRLQRIKAGHVTHSDLLATGTKLSAIKPLFMHQWQSNAVGRNSVLVKLHPFTPAAESGLTSVLTQLDAMLELGKTA
jgi:hypothetical protein